MLTNALMIWPEQPALSLVVWLSLLILVMYLGRHQSHQLLRTSGRSIHRTMRLCARSLNLWQSSLAERNRAILLAEGEAQSQRIIEREFVRVNGIVARDLSHYPTLHRQISDTVSKIEQDYNSTIEAPPSPPAWLEVVETVAAIPRNGDPAVAKILDKIHDTVSDAHRETMDAYNKNSQQSHKTLSKMQPLWRQAISDLDNVKRNIDGLEERAEVIDQHMQNYERIRAKDDATLQGLTTSSLTQFFISALVLFIAVMGGLINFQLIAMPMSEMVGGTSYIGAMKTSDIAALVIIMVEIAMGLFLLESLRITHLFPIIGSLDDTLRRRMIVITLLILTILATVEASLAYMRDLLALDREALKQSLAGAGVVEANFRWIPSIGQMVMGFILPFALAFVAIPLESFIHSLRTVLGLIGQGVLRALAVVARLIGNAVNYFCKVLIHLYDLIIMVPLSIERLIVRQQDKPVRDSKPEPLALTASDHQGAES
ncbi:hypothetical protein MIB92_08745 [Aestuariirhabdus sp. Z084]|uniref:hypothetical protein n=1 Tax=Aestuariirhabdus haliotis TaxID=2918751 RepID=UPI00201B441C|nr:hypothetical protein [Aestuariirhabdus haliotis]MCL6415737.1 hypothetical protein [Aestuariirhabdus haliotis]MCL6419737.1 hypothetical protein [Aestuariirhabdus haliotis]